MIGLILVGAALGGLIYLLILRLAPPRPSPLVHLGRLDARVVSAPSAEPADATGQSGQLLSRWQARVGRLVWEQLGRRGSRMATSPSTGRRNTAWRGSSICMASSRRA